MATPKHTNAAQAVVKRRRKSGKPGQGESSREASAESNDETATDNDPMAGDDTDTASLASPRPSARTGDESFDDTQLPAAPAASAMASLSAAPTVITAKFRRPQTLVAAATANSSMSTLGDVVAKGPLEKRQDYGAEVESGIDESGHSTYDGDVSSAPGVGAGAATRKVKIQQQPQQHQQHPSDGSMSGQSRRGSETIPGSALSKMSLASDFADDEQSTIDTIMSPLGMPSSPPPPPPPGSNVLSTFSQQSTNHPPAPHGFLARMQAGELQEKMREAIEDKAGQRAYKINSPPIDRPVRIYADGVYDLFHYGHALQLRQCKLFFPSVELLVGVCSDELVLKHKASPVLKSAERYESVRNCKWVDEVVEDAPWQVDEEFLNKHRIDYVAHDEEPYVSSDSSDVYSYVKSQGKFLPTRRTDGVSTSELLQRIVEGYTHGAYDGKLDKIGAGGLAWSEMSHEAGRGGTRPHTPSAGQSGRRSGVDSGIASPSSKQGFSEDTGGHLLVPEAEMHDPSHVTS